MLVVVEKENKLMSTKNQKKKKIDYFIKRNVLFLFVCLGVVFVNIISEKYLITN